MAKTFISCGLKRNGKPMRRESNEEIYQRAKEITDDLIAVGVKPDRSLARIIGMYVNAKMDLSHF